MNTNSVPLAPARQPRSLTLALIMLCAGSPGSLIAQTPCPGAAIFATGLLAPAKIMQTPGGDFIVADGGPQVRDSGRVSIVDRQSTRPRVAAGNTLSCPSTLTNMGLDHKGARVVITGTGHRPAGHAGVAVNVKVQRRGDCWLTQNRTAL